MKIAKKGKVNDYLSLLSIDVNGLKTVNDFGVSHGHIDGNKFLLAFTHILQSGKTTKFLEKNGLKVTVAAQSGDEYLILLEAKKPLRSVISLIQQMYTTELWQVESLNITRRIRRPDGTITDYKREFKEIDIAHIIDYESEDTKNLFLAKGVKLNKKEKFHLTCSFGWSSFRQVLSEIDLGQFDDFSFMKKEIQNILFSISDHDAVKNKKAFKEYLKEKGFAQLHTLLTIRSDMMEIIEMKRENRRLKGLLRGRKV